MGLIKLASNIFSKHFSATITLAAGWELYVPYNQVNKFTAFIDIGDDNLITTVIKYSDGEDTYTVNMYIVDTQVTIDAIFLGYQSIQVNSELKQIHLFR
ncbi:hypothetical protein DOK78_000851 [Enterococcus sp. DIV2402]|uniref:Uncharacterized protein n=1 Tax=Candidatus Enterococcus lowellii TaxID=2230877 RepID=A0ABZ2SL09_9ENTE|nr:hypothetical protein [Enterococcus sp. DIV2402]MBO0465816.1 hypothetical protein [Enterococcus sp. DIV2402]